MKLKLYEEFVQDLKDNAINESYYPILPDTEEIEKIKSQLLEEFSLYENVNEDCITKVEHHGIKDDKLFITIDNELHTYQGIELSIDDIAQKFAIALELSIPNAIEWLNKNANLVDKSLSGKESVDKIKDALKNGRL